MTWNYRIMRRVYTDTVDGKMFTAEALEARMTEAASKPILDYETGKETARQ